MIREQRPSKKAVSVQLVALGAIGLTAAGVLWLALSVGPSEPSSKQTEAANPEAQQSVAATSGGIDALPEAVPLRTSKSAQADAPAQTGGPSLPPKPDSIFIEHVEYPVEWEGDLRRVLHPNGTPRSEVRIVDGKWEGTLEAWHDNGVLSTKEEWRNGRREGPAIQFSSKGTLVAKGEYKDGFPFGPWEYYDPKSANLVKRGSYALGGRETGPWEYRSSDGWLVRRGSYEDGEETGIWEYYYPTGALWRRGEYVDGKMNGFWEEFEPDGKLNEGRSVIYDHGREVKD